MSKAIKIFKLLLSLYLPTFFCQTALGSSVFLDFTDDQHNWKSNFSDYHIDQIETINFCSGAQTIPNLNQDGYLLGSSNVSDDLFMYIATKRSNLTPSADYQVRFSNLIFATNVPANLAGIGGRPGESVFIKVGASTVEPTPENAGHGRVRMNIDQGHQANSGSNAIQIGNFAKASSDATHTYELKTLNAPKSITMKTNDLGELWLFVGTDSGFEGRTEIYFVSSNVKINLLQ